MLGEMIESAGLVVDAQSTAANGMAPVKTACFQGPNAAQPGALPLRDARVLVCANQIQLN